MKVRSEIGKLAAQTHGILLTPYQDKLWKKIRNPKVRLDIYRLLVKSPEKFRDDILKAFIGKQQLLASMDIQIESLLKDHSDPESDSYE